MVRRTDVDPGWINRRFATLERQVREANAAKRLPASTVSKGDVIVAGGNLIVRGTGDLLLQDAAGATLWQASQDPIKTSWSYAENNAMSLPTTWTVVGTSTVTKPAGWTGSGHFLVMVSAGDTFSTSGNVSVQPLFRYRYADGTVGSWFSGPAISSGNSSASVASSFWATNFALSAAASAVDFGVNAGRSGAEASATNGNWHLAASVIFKRG